MTNPALSGKSVRNPLIFIVITLTIDAMGIGLILPVMPDLLREIDGGTVGQAALWGGVLATLFAVMQFLFGPTIGSPTGLSRRPVLLVSLFILAVDYVMALAGTIWLLLIARGVAASHRPPCRRLRPISLTFPSRMKKPHALALWAPPSASASCWAPYWAGCCPNLAPAPRSMQPGPWRF